MIHLAALVLATTSPAAPAFAVDSAPPASTLLSSTSAAPPGFDLSIAPTFEPAAPEDPPKLNVWTGTIGIGVTSADGNTEKTSASASANVERRGEKNRWSFSLLWNYADEDGDVTQRRTLFTAQYDYFLTKKAYLLAQTSAENDYNAALDLRTTIGVGAGYQFREDEKWKVSGEGGLSYVDENFKGSADDASFLAARLAYKVDCKPSESWSVGNWGEVFPSLEDMDDVNARLDTHAKVSLTKAMFAGFQWLYTWDNTPATGAERVDNLYLLTLGWSF